MSDLIDRAIGGTTLDESVKALKDVFVDHDPAEKREPKSDLISRQEAIRWVKTECNPYGKPTLDFESGKKVIEHLEQMPSAEPEREKGKWVFSRGHTECACTLCNFKIYGRPYNNTYLIVPYNYCPNCGHPMEVDDERSG